MTTSAVAKQKTKPRMSVGFSVFNCHLNNAKGRADKEFIAQFGQEAFDERIAPIHASGIMSIFHQPPDRYTGPWVALVTAYVNEDRSAATAALPEEGEE